MQIDLMKQTIQRNWFMEIIKYYFLNEEMLLI